MMWGAACDVTSFHGSTWVTLSCLFFPGGCDIKGGGSDAISSHPSHITALFLRVKEMMSRVVITSVPAGLVFFAFFVCGGSDVTGGSSDVTFSHWSSQPFSLYSDVMEVVMISFHPMAPPPSLLLFKEGVMSWHMRLDVTCSHGSPCLFMEAVTWGRFQCRILP